MKTKFFVALCLIVSLVACSGLQKNSIPKTDGELLNLEQLVSKSGANVVRAFTCLTGGTTGCLDKILYGSITVGDIAMVTTGNIIYFYQFNAANQTEDARYNYICPDNGVSAGTCTNGTWYLVDVRAKGVNTGASSLPAITFFDIDATDGDENAKIYVNCTTTTSGAENCQMYFQTQTAGTLATRASIDETGSFNAPLVPIIKNAEGANSLTAAQCQGQLVLLGHVDAISDLTLPDYQAALAADHVTIGAMVCVAAVSAYAHTIHPAADDKIRTSNLTLNAAGAGVTYTTASTPIGGYVCFVLTDAASDVGHWTQFGISGTWPIH